MTKHVMFDIETMGGAPDGAVVAIGAVKFNRKKILEKYEVYIPPGNAVLYGRRDDRTMAWWATQEKEVYAKVFGGTTPPAQACEGFAEFCRGSDVVWAKPPTFDIVVLRHLYTQMGTTFPFHFRAERDARTLFKLAREYGVKFDECFEGSTKHAPLSDALVQTFQVMKCLNLISFRRS